jgi:hypothetical protein
MNYFVKVFRRAVPVFSRNAMTIAAAVIYRFEIRG